MAALSQASSEAFRRPSFAWDRAFCPAPLSAHPPCEFRLLATAPLPCCSWLELKYFHFEISYVPYMLETWETVLVLTFLLSMLLLTGWGALNVALRYLSQ